MQAYACIYAHMENSGCGAQLATWRHGDIATFSGGQRLLVERWGVSPRSTGAGEAGQALKRAIDGEAKISERLRHGCKAGPW